MDDGLAHPNSKINFIEELKKQEYEFMEFINS
jgi:hypothetical protein